MTMTKHIYVAFIEGFSAEWWSFCRNIKHFSECVKMFYVTEGAKHYCVGAFLISLTKTRSK